MLLNKEPTIDLMYSFIALERTSMIINAMIR